MKRTLIASAVTMALASSAHAGLQFDPDGSGGLSGTLDIKAFDWSPTSFFADGGNAAIAAFLADRADNGRVDNQHFFNTYTHATLIGVTPSNGAPSFAPNGLNTSYEITMIAGFGERVTSVLDADVDQVTGEVISGPLARFATTNVGGVIGKRVDAAGALTLDPFVQIYFNSIGTSRSDALSGAGFNDGTLIFDSRRILNSSTGNFELLGSSIPDGNGGFVFVPDILPLDDSPVGDNDFPDTQTVKGTGGQGDINVGVDGVDANFFKSLFASISLSYQNISIALNYKTVDPSDCFTGGPSGATIGGPAVLTSGCSFVHDGAAGGVPDFGPEGGVNALVPVVGPINGLILPGFNSPDFIAQTDFNSAVNGAIPEPGSLALVGLGMTAFAAAARRRRRQGA